MRTARILSSEVVAKAWGKLTQYTFQYSKLSGELTEMTREVYDRGHAAAILLHDPERDMVTLVRQFRPPAMVNGGNPFLVEVCAGVLDGDAPATCARKEALEEAGIVVKDIRLVTTAYGLPAAVTELLSLFIGTYHSKTEQGGGLPDEGEDIEVLELPFQVAFQMISSGEIVDMKTIVLLQHLMLERVATSNNLSPPA